jgi:hypothetical protein
LEKNISPVGKMKKASGGKPGLLVLTFKNRIAYETEHESIHQVSHRGRVLCHRHLPHQLVYRRTRDRKEPATAAGEQYLDKGRL